MGIDSVAVIAAITMLILLLSGVPIAYSLGFTAVVLGVVAFGGLSLDKIGWTTYHLLYNQSWTPLPMFTLMACVIAQTRIGEDLYRSARNWLAAIPGGIVAASIAGQGVLAAALGASAPALITVGKVAEPELKKFGYDMGFSVGAILCGGVLGPLIPPSAIMVIYAVVANVSLGRLLMAGILPGILLACMLIGVAVVKCARNPALGGPAEKVPFKIKIKSLRNVWAVVLIMISILGSIYFGIATPTEAAAVGSVVLLIISIVAYKLRFKGLMTALTEAALLNAVLMFTIIGANLFSYVIGSSSLAEMLMGFVSNAPFAPIFIVVILMLVLLCLGFFLDGITIMLLTVPIIVPVITGLGFDPIWLGVLYVVNMEIGLITPPMAVNFFLARNIFNVKTRDLAFGMLPFLFTLIIFLFIVLSFPELATWLPNTMAGR
ncbi:MAG: TRAP transporter large permease subunit [Bacillota bacterium]|nr:TRAP transporter large permease subunit [Bacillota bacterium]